MFQKDMCVVTIYHPRSMCAHEAKKKRRRSHGSCLPWHILKLQITCVNWGWMGKFVTIYKCSMSLKHLLNTKDMNATHIQCFIVIFVASSIRLITLIDCIAPRHVGLLLKPNSNFRTRTMDHTILWDNIVKLHLLKSLR